MSTAKFELIQTPNLLCQFTGEEHEIDPNTLPPDVVEAIREGRGMGLCEPHGTFSIGRAPVPDPFDPAAT